MVHSQALFWITHVQYRFWSNLTLCPCSTDMKRWDKTKQTQDRSVERGWDKMNKYLVTDRKTNSLTDRQIFIYMFCCIANLYFEHNAFNTNSEANFPCALLLPTSNGRHMRWRRIEMGWICCDRQTNSRTDRQIYMLYLYYLPFHIWYMTYLYFQHKILRQPYPVPLFYWHQKVRQNKTNPRQIGDRHMRWKWVEIWGTSRICKKGGQDPKRGGRVADITRK